MTDLEIARAQTMRPISDIARAAGIQEETLSPYGRYIAKVDPAPYAAQPDRARLVLVTAINPTPAGEARPPSAWAWPTASPSWARSPCWPCGSRPWGRYSA